MTRAEAKPAVFSFRTGHQATPPAPGVAPTVRTTTMGFSRDLRQATRIFSRSPGFAAISVIALALGVGLTTTMFSIVNGALFKGLPFPDSKRIVHVERNNLSAGIVFHDSTGTTLSGVVVSDTRDKTVTVEVVSSKTHPKYKKTIQVRKKFHAHDELNDANLGDTVRIVETRPLSKTKRWRVTEVVERAR